MYLTLWICFLIVSLILVSIGLFRPEHTEMALIGFVFIFLLGLSVEAGSIQYKTGINETYSYKCLCCTDGRVGEDQSCEDDTTLSIDSIAHTDTYEEFEAGGVLSHLLGYWLMVMAVVGFIGVLVGIRAQRFT